MRIIISIILLITVGYAVDKTGTSAAKFLSIKSGSRAMGMGGAFTAVATDGSTMAWNPAGIARLNGNTYYMEHSKWLVDIYHNYLGFTFKNGSHSAWGMNYIALGMPEMQVTRYGEENTGETFRAGSWALGITWAVNLTHRFSIGFNGKYIRETISRSYVNGAALDVGTLFNTIYGPVLGMSISHFGPKMQMQGADLLVTTDDVSNNPDINADLSTEKFNLPLTLRFGISNIHNFDSITLLWAVDAVSPMDNAEYVNTGLEIMFFNRAYLRSGLSSLFLPNSESVLNLGAGVELNLFGHHGLQLDYAYEVMRYLNDVHKFSLSINR
ncbi:MAG: PorV/PorQ family protein [Candidatus Marinimicrobia bacterium]|nr:PorV/PorQ family protein [Candidatus Neomarinimicrobiota bacterium]